MLKYPRIHAGAHLATAIQLFAMWLLDLLQLILQLKDVACCLMLQVTLTGLPVPEFPAVTTIPYGLSILNSDDVNFTGRFPSLTTLSEGLSIAGCNSEAFLELHYELLASNKSHCSITPTLGMHKPLHLLELHYELLASNHLHCINTTPPPPGGSYAQASASTQLSNYVRDTRPTSSNRLQQRIGPSLPHKQTPLGLFS